MSEKSLNRARWVSSVAATCISLACGTNVGLKSAINIVILTIIVCLFSMGSAVWRKTQALIDRAEPDCMSIILLRRLDNS